MNLLLFNQFTIWIKSFTSFKLVDETSIPEYEIHALDSLSLCHNKGLMQRLRSLQIIWILSGLASLQSLQSLQLQIDVIWRGNQESNPETHDDRETAYTWTWTWNAHDCSSPHCLVKNEMDVWDDLSPLTDYIRDSGLVPKIIHSLTLIVIRGDTVQCSKSNMYMYIYIYTWLMRPTNLYLAQLD